MPLRLRAVEAELEGGTATPETLAAAAEHAARGTNPLPQTAHKVPLLIGTVSEVLERALGDGAANR